MITQPHCSQHNCPLVHVGGIDVCVLEHARSLVSQPIIDLAFSDDLTVLLFPSYACLPLLGWNGNARARGDEENAAALLDILDGSYLTGLRWQKSHQQLDIYIGDDPTIETGQWIIHLSFVRA